MYYRTELIKKVCVYHNYDDQSLGCYADATITQNPRKGVTLSRGYYSSFWNSLTAGADIPDPYAALGQFRTMRYSAGYTNVTSFKPASSGDYSWNCVDNAGRCQEGGRQGWAKYDCNSRVASDWTCDVSKGGMSVSDPAACNGTRVFCVPPVGAPELATYFARIIPGLRLVTAKVFNQGRNEHELRDLSFETIYERDPAITGGLPLIANIDILFPSVVADRLRTASCAAATPYYIGAGQCAAACPAPPVLNAMSILNYSCRAQQCAEGQRPDGTQTNCIPCADQQVCVTCPPDKVRYSTTYSKCLCNPGTSRAADTVACTPCGFTPAFNQVWRPDYSNPGEYTCGLNGCSGNPNADHTVCIPNCLPGYGPDGSGACVPCGLTPSPTSIWQSDIDAQERRTYKCATESCPANNYASGQYSACSPCGQDASANFTVALVGSTPTCTFSACAPGYRNYNSTTRTCAACGGSFPTGTLPVYTAGTCVVTSCSITDTAKIASVDSVCEITACQPGYTLCGRQCITTPACTAGTYFDTGTCVCTACRTAPPGITQTYSTGCTAATCAINAADTQSTGIQSVNLMSGNCDVTCKNGYSLGNDKLCTACTPPVDSYGRTYTYATNTCTVTSCGVTAALTSMATASLVNGNCVLRNKAGYYITRNPQTIVATAVTACPLGETGTSYTYATPTDSDPKASCELATCSYTNAADTNETASAVVTNGLYECKKVCRTGKTRAANGTCSDNCPANTDAGLTITYGPYGCKISACTTASSAGVAAITNGAGTDTCALQCPGGYRMVTDATNRNYCTNCADINVTTNSFDIGSPCNVPAYRTQCYPIHAGVTVAMTAARTCTATCNSGFVKDADGVCRKCPGETPSSTSAIVGGVCVTTCKANYSRDVAQDAIHPQLSRTMIECPTCIAPYVRDSYPSHILDKVCIYPASSTTASTVISYIGGEWRMTCQSNYYFNKTTGVCTQCSRPSNGSTDEPGTLLLVYDDQEGGCSASSTTCSVTSSTVATTSYSNGKCVISSCATGYVKNAGSGACSDCNYGYSKNAAGACVACPVTLASTAHWSAIGSCTTANCTGRSQPNAAKTGCDACSLILSEYWTAASGCAKGTCIGRSVAATDGLSCTTCSLEDTNDSVWDADTGCGQHICSTEPSATLTTRLRPGYTSEAGSVTLSSSRSACYTFSLSRDGTTKWASTDLRDITQVCVAGRSDSDTTTQYPSCSSTCSAGSTYQDGTGRTCQSCTRPTASQYVSSACTAATNTGIGTKLLASSCTLGTSYLVPGTTGTVAGGGGTPGYCKPCSPDCVSPQVQAYACTRTMDRVCTAAMTLFTKTASRSITGNTIKTLVGVTTTDCATACYTTAFCVSFQIQTGICYLKSVKSPLTLTAGSDVYVKK